MPYFSTTEETIKCINLFTVLTSAQNENCSSNYKHVMIHKARPHKYKQLWSDTALTQPKVTGGERLVTHLFLHFLGTPKQINCKGVDIISACTHSIYHSHNNQIKDSVPPALLFAGNSFS
jgi:hypothetical protein